MLFFMILKEILSHKGLNLSKIKENCVKLTIFYTSEGRSPENLRQSKIFQWSIKYVSILKQDQYDIAAYTCFARSTSMLCHQRFTKILMILLNFTIFFKFTLNLRPNRRSAKRYFRSFILTPSDGVFEHCCAFLAPGKWRSAVMFSKTNGAEVASVKLSLLIPLHLQDYV